MRQTGLSMSTIIESNFRFPSLFSTPLPIFGVVLSRCYLESSAVFTMCQLVYLDMV